MVTPRLLAGLGAAVLAAVPVAGFEGRVVLESGEPAAGAIVQILGAPGSATTDADGRFEWLPAPSPPFHVLVVLSGDRYTAPVFVESMEEAALIEVAPLSLTETVTVTSGAVPHTEATPASAPSVVRGEAIRTRQTPRLTDVLETVPGGGRSSDLHAGVPSIRGLSRGRTVLLLDGARIVTERRAGPSATFLDPFFLEAVEIVRGPSPVAYGSDAFGGVIHARTRRPSPGDPFTARARTTWGAGLPEASFGAEASGSLAGTGLLVQGRRRSFGDYRSPAGVVSGSGAEDYGFLARGVREVPGGTLTTSVQVDGARDVGRPRRTSSVTSYPVEDSTRLVADYQVLPRWGFARLDATVFLGAQRLVTRRESGDPVGASVADSDLTARDLMVRAHGVRPFGEGRLELGLEMLSRFGLSSTTWSSGPEAVALAGLGAGGEGFGSLLDGAHREELSFYTHAETRLSPLLSGSGGVRLSGVTTRSGAATAAGSGAAHRTDHGALSGFVAMRADLSRGASLTGQLSRGFRDPTLSDRYYAGLSGRGVVFGNPELRPERSIQSDLSFRLGRGAARWGLHAYRYRIHDLVERYEDGVDLYFFRNRGEALLSGVEVEMQLDASGGRLGVDLGASLASGAAEDGGALDGVPPASVRAGVRRRLLERAFAEVVVHAFAADTEPGPTETAQAAYTRLDAAFGVPLAASAELRLSGRNLLNAAYPISADSRAVLAPGRTVVGTIVWSLGEAP